MVNLLACFGIEGHGIPRYSSEEVLICDNIWFCEVISHFAFVCMFFFYYSLVLFLCTSLGTLISLFGISNLDEPGPRRRGPLPDPPPSHPSCTLLCSLGLAFPPTLTLSQTGDDDGMHVTFVVHTQVEATQEAWDSPRRYREFTQLRKRLLRLGIDIPTSATAAAAGRSGGDAGSSEGGGGIAASLPKKAWRAKKFDIEHLETRRAALEAFLQAAVKVGGHPVLRDLEGCKIFVCGTAKIATSRVGDGKNLN